jgi:hypothetical protein
MEMGRLACSVGVFLLTRSDLNLARLPLGSRKGITTRVNAFTSPYPPFSPFSAFICLYLDSPSRSHPRILTFDIFIIFILMTL